MDETTVARNAAELARLESLLAGLSDEDLVRPVGEGWTVAVTLAHLAFWESFDLQILSRWQQGASLPIEPDWYADAYNEALLPMWRLLPPREMVSMVLEASRRIDALVATLDDGIVAQMRQRNEMWWVRRYLHRREHLAQIEAALASQ